MQIKYFDAHCHVQFDAYGADREELIARMKERGVAGIVVGVDRESSAQAVELAEKHEHLYASVGLHPNRVGTEQYDISYYRQLAASPKVVAIGECGLDYFRPEKFDEEVKRKQRTLLKEHIALAAELDKPLIIHSRPSKGTYDAYQELIAILTEASATSPFSHDRTKIGIPEAGRLRGDIHFFVGGVDEMRALVALDFTVSYTAVITFARDYDDIIRAVPPGSLLSETDAPYVSPASRPRGSRNDPLAVEDVVLKLAEIREEEPETFRQAILANAIKTFSLSGIEVA
ncbi:MAG: TatD family hydrolase [bacterium]|nr:TatD family hydrolase [bacterium]